MRIDGPEHGVRQRVDPRAGGWQEARRGSVLRLRASGANGAQKSQSSSSVSTALPMT